MTDPESTAPEPQKVAGGIELEIAYEDGRTERVKIHQLRPGTDFQRYLEVQQNESEEVELYCRREKGWAETLSIESFSAIADMGQELNLPFFRNWYRRLSARAEAISPGILEKATTEALAAVRP